MTDPRVDAIVAAVAARYPTASIEIRPCPDSESFQIPDFLVILDASRAELRAAEDYALELVRVAFPGQDVPFSVGALTPRRAEEYFKGPHALQSSAGP
jgi:hypothetical protein